MKPYNLVIITPDQLRADYLGCYGHPSIGTRHIDRLSQEGVRFDNCYCQSPLCAPSRISFATSSYVGEHGCRNYWSTISPEVPNLVTSLKSANYRSGMFGKNHLFTYERLGDVWDELHEVCLGNYDGHPLYESSYSSFELEEDHPYNKTGQLTEETIDFIERSTSEHGDQPFFAWVNYQDPHPAFTCPQPYKDLFDPNDVELPSSFTSYDADSQPVRNAVWRQHSEMDSCSEADIRSAIATYMGQTRYVDDSVGRILDTLQRLDLDRSTVVLFFSDHGELLGDFGMTHKLPVFYECLAKIPAIIRHPDGRWSGSSFEGLTEEVDLAPTLLEMLGVPIPPTMVGKSWVQALDQNDDSGKNSILCEAGGGAPTAKEATSGLRLKAPQLPTSLGPGAMIRQGDWKLSIYHDDHCELYNLEADPNELRNRYGDPDCADKQAELTTELSKRLLGVKVRDVGTRWPDNQHPVDVRFEPLQKMSVDLADITGLESPKAAAEK